ncbi:unnamed protein product [Brassica napus]|uniref:(rape) hypothetical protein n=1 Tax=Brassica napus TaxID=3708 RepID=A0A816RMF2_BRANA|nr:unnamed protein product [Brassica napus]
MISAHASGKSQVALIDEQVCFISANRAPRYEPQLKPGANDRLQNFFVYHPKHTQTSVSVSSFTPPISELFGILPRRFLFFASPPKEAGKNISHCGILSLWFQSLFLLCICCFFLPTSDSPTGETTFSATAELPMLSANVLSASSKGCGDLADEGMVAQITVAKHRKPNVLLMANMYFKFSSFLAPFDLTKKKMMNVILDPIEDSTESQAEQTYSLLGMCRETLVVSFQWCTYITLSLLIFTAAFDGLQSSFAEQKSVSLLSVLVF